MSTGTIALMYAKLEESCLTKKDQQHLGIKFLNKAKTKLLVDKELAAMQIPYYDINGKIIKNYYRVRFLENITKATFTNTAKQQRYTQPANTAPHFYLPNLVIPTELGPTPWSVIATNVEVSLIFTEGELKAACACKYGFPTVSIGGVYAFRSRKKGKPLIDDFKIFAWDGRTVTLIFDSDLATNKNVQRALRELAKELSALGAHVYIGYLPALPGMEDKTGLDDFIKSQGAEALHTVLHDAEAFTENEALWNLNDEVAYIKELGEVLELKTGQRMKPANFKEHAYSHYRHKYYAGDKLLEKSTAAEWLKWPARHTLKNVSYAPGHPLILNNETYNTWKGWGCPATKGDVAPWHRLMRAIFGKNPKERQWFERWLAYQVQHPGVKLKTAVLIWGIAQGTGKSLIGYLMRNIFGKANFTEIGNNNLTESFNEWLAEKQFIMVDEVFDVSGHYREVGETLKRLITQEEVSVNVKFRMKYKVPDVANYYLTSNRPNALPLDDKDRRYFIWEVQTAESENWFVKTVDPWLKGTGPSAMRYYLANLSLGNFDANTKAPETAAKEEMVYHGRSAVSTWCAQLKKDPDSILEDARVTADLLTNTQLLEIFKGDDNTKITKNILGRELKQAGFEKRTIKVGLRAEAVYIVRNQHLWASKSAYAFTEHYVKQFPPIASQHTRATRRIVSELPKKPRKF